MTITDQITIAETKAQDTAGRFIAATDNPAERQRLAAQYREELSAVNALKNAHTS